MARCIFWHRSTSPKVTCGRYARWQRDEMGGKSYEMRRHDSYCSNSSCSPETLVAGLRPEARRARGLPSNRSRPVTNPAVPSGCPLPSARAVSQLLWTSRGVVFLGRKPRNGLSLPGFPAAQHWPRTIMCDTGNPGSVYTNCETALAGDPQSPDLESSIATQQNGACDQAQGERSPVRHRRHLNVL